MQPVESCLHCQFLNHVLKALSFHQNSPKIKLFLQKNAKFSSAGDSAPRPPCVWRIRPQTPINLRRLGTPPPDPSTQPPTANFWLHACLTVTGAPEMPIH